MINKCAVIFTCALVLLLTIKTNGAEKMCRIRDKDLCPPDIFNLQSGFLCYAYTNQFRLKFRYDNVIINYKNYSIQVTMIDDTNAFGYDYLDNTTQKYLPLSFKTYDFYLMWVDCCKEAVSCCTDFMTDENIFPNENYPCPAIWDGWTCFPPSKSNTFVHKTCTKQAYSTTSDVCELQSQKHCLKNGTWDQTTDYGVCAIAPVLRYRHTFNVIALAVATVLAFPAVVIFFSLRTFRKDLRYIMHRNLILIIVVRNFLTIMSKEIIILDALASKSHHVMDNNSVACRVLAFFENAAKNGMYACMLADGFYLHKLIVRPFSSDPSLVFIYIVVVVLSFLPSVIWAAVRAAHGADDCWMVDETGDQWIVDGFRIAILVINFLLLLDIVRVMIMKLKQNNMTQHTKSTLKATLFLIPIFGVYILIITNRNMVTSNACRAQDIYYYISYLVEGLQGVMVAVLFCYINADVRKELKNAFRKLMLELESRFDIKIGKKQDYRRRITAATYVDDTENFSRT